MGADVILVSIVLLLMALAGAGWWTSDHPAEVLALVSWVRQLGFMRRYRSLLKALARRLNPQAALALVIIGGLSVLLFCVWIFRLLEQVIAQEETALFDAPVLNFVATHRVPWLARTMELVTVGGSELFIVLLTIAIGIAFRYRTHSWQPLLLLATSVLGAMLLEHVAKDVVARARPPSAWVAGRAGDGFAFPSGHSARAAAAYGALAYLLAQTQIGWKSKARTLTLGTLIAFLIGISRVYLGVHWPTDVIAGWALGLVWLLIVFTAYSAIIEERWDSGVARKPDRG